MNSFMLILLVYMPTPFGDILHNLETLQGTPFPTMETCVTQGEEVKKLVPDISYVCVPESMMPERPPAPEPMPEAPKEKGPKVLRL